MKIRRGNAFLINTGKGILNAVTAIAIFRRSDDTASITATDVASMVQSWTINEPGKPIRLGKPRKLETIDSWTNPWLVLELSGSDYGRSKRCTSSMPPAGNRSSIVATSRAER